MTLPEHVDSAGQVDALLRILRRYADSSLGRRLSDAFNELAEGGREGLPAFEAGSEERHVEAVLVAVHQKLSLIVLDLALEIGSARLDAAKWVDDIAPEDFGGESW
jgi:hypothetical protein